MVLLYKFSCYRNDACVEGGESVLLDAFAVVEEMRVKHPQHFATLTRVPATFVKAPPMLLVHCKIKRIVVLTIAFVV